MDGVVRDVYELVVQITEVVGANYRSCWCCCCQARINMLNELSWGLKAGNGGGLNMLL